jgi:hypothetical protein
VSPRNEPRGGKFIATATRNDKRPASYIGSKFPELGPIPPIGDDCQPPTIVCGRCDTCNEYAAHRLASYAVNSDTPEDSKADDLKLAMMMLGMMPTPTDTTPTDKEAV